MPGIAQDITCNMITLALIGTGRWGKNFITTINSIKDCRLKYICSKDKDELSSLPVRYVKTADHTELFKYPDVNGVIIATPGSTHYRIAKDFLERGFNLLIEKPMTTSYKDALELKRLHDRTRSQVLVGHLHLYNPAYQRTKQLLKEIGEIRYLSFEGLNNGPFRDDMSALWDWGPHPVSMFLDLLGKEPKEISAWAVNKLRPKTKLYDLVYLNFDFPGNIQAFAKIGWLLPVKKFSLTAVGTKSTVVFDDTAAKKVIYYKNIGPQVKGVTVVKNEPKVIYPTYSTKPSLEIEVREFIKAIKTGKRPKTDLEHGVKVIKVIQDCEACLYPPPPS